MIDEVRSWFALLKSQWWGGIIVYGLIVAATYSVLWLIFDSQRVPDLVNLFASSIDRRLILVMGSLTAGSHVTLLLELLLRRSKSMPAPISPIEPPIIESTRFFPERKDLIIRRVAMKDGKLSQENFASLVLLTLNCKRIDERSAHEFLRSSTFDVRALRSGVYTLVEDKSL